MFSLAVWQAALLGLGLAVLVLLLAIWWRQQTFRWTIVLAFCLIGAPLLSWWSGIAFEVPDYQAGCDGFCPGYRGAPVPTYRGEAAGGEFVPGLFILNSLVYLALLLGWSAVLRAVVRRAGSTPRRSFWVQAALGLVLWAGPFALSPLYLPPPEARVHGEPQRIAINAGREVYMYDQLAPALVLRVGLEDVRPRPDGQSGMRVCLRLYTYFYLPIGHMALDMTVEGVHSNNGEVLSMEASCWK